MYLGFCVAIGALCWNYYDYRAMAAETLWNSGFAEMRPQRNVSSWEYPRSQPSVLLHYLPMLVFTIGLCAYCSLPIETRPIIYLSKGALILETFGAGICLLWKKKPLGFLVVSFFLILAPTSTVLPLVLAYEHRVHLGSACVFAIITSLIARWILKQTNNPERVEIDWRVKGAFAGLIVCTLGLAKLTLDRNTLYQSETKFWTDVTEKRPQNPRRCLNLAAAAYQQADDVQLADQYAQQACKVAPNFARAWKGSVALRLNQAIFVDANRRFENALSVLPWNIRIFGQIMLNHSWVQDVLQLPSKFTTPSVCTQSANHPNNLTVRSRNRWPYCSLGDQLKRWRQRKQLLKSTMNPLTTDRSKPSLLCIRKTRSGGGITCQSGPYRS